ncbi:lipoprotein signal peptidase [Campylobacterota bacterium]|nr:lipoprotein signal peptidase [Campylobacterota bacterium]
MRIKSPIKISPIAVFWICFFAAMIADQLVKLAILNGFRWESEAISITLTFNEGVAFSFFASIGSALKYIQTALVLGIMIYVFRAKLLADYALPIGILLGAGSSNVLDRFMHIGVVDYVYWHYWFDFAIFNLADVFIDCAIVMIVVIHIRSLKNAV